jgi:hypothetical protein
MMMSVFRQGRPRSQLDHLACMDIAASTLDLELITFAFMNAKATLVGMDGAEAIIKTLDAGDEAMSFEALYDSCITIRDLETMQRHKVTSPDALKSLLYQADLVFQVDFYPRVRLNLRAKDEQDFRDRLTVLLDNDAFKLRLTEELANQIFTSEEVSLKSAGPLKIGDPAPDDAPEWDFVIIA